MEAVLICMLFLQGICMLFMYCLEYSSGDCPRACSLPNSFSEVLGDLQVPEGRRELGSPSTRALRGWGPHG